MYYAQGHTVNSRAGIQNRLIWFRGLIAGGGGGTGPGGVRETWVSTVIPFLISWAGSLIPLTFPSHSWLSGEGVLCISIIMKEPDISHLLSPAEILRIGGGGGGRDVQGVFIGETS